MGSRVGVRADDVQRLSLVDELLGERHLATPGLPRFGDHVLVVDGAVEVTSGVVLGDVEPRGVAARHGDPEPDLLHLGQVAQQPEQRQGRGLHGPSGHLLGVEAVAFHREGEPVVAQVVEQHLTLADRGGLVLARVVLGSTHMSGDFVASDAMGRIFVGGQVLVQSPVRLRAHTWAADDSTSLGEQHGLIVPLVALRTSDQAAQLSQTGSLDMGGNVICRVEVSLELDLVTEPR